MADQQNNPPDTRAPVGEPEFDFVLRRQLKRLQQDRDPSHELWPGIAARLDVPRASALHVRRSGGNGLRWLALAASVLLVAVVLRPAALFIRPATETTPTAAMAPTEGLEAPTPAGNRQLRVQTQAMTAEYHAALDQMATVVLPIPLQAAIDELDRSAEQIRGALAHDPESLFLLKRLRSVYEQRLRLTQRIYLA